MIPDGLRASWKSRRFWTAVQAFLKAGAVQLLPVLAALWNWTPAQVDAAQHAANLLSALAVAGGAVVNLGTAYEDGAAKAAGAPQPWMRPPGGTP